MKKGFTLIELLVVVLIIGILSSVALPQYERAVSKARATEALSTRKALIEAENVYYLSNGTYTSDLDLLDLKIPELKNFTLEIESAGNGGMIFNFHGKNSMDGLKSGYGLWSDGRVHNFNCWDSKNKGRCGVFSVCGELNVSLGCASCYSNDGF